MSLFDGISRETAQQIVTDCINNSSMTVLEFVEEIHSNPALAAMIGELYLNPGPCKRDKEVTSKARVAKSRGRACAAIVEYLRKHGESSLRDMRRALAKGAPDSVFSARVGYLRSRGILRNTGYGMWDLA